MDGGHGNDNPDMPIEIIPPPIRERLLVVRKNYHNYFIKHDKYADYIVNTGFYDLYNIGCIRVDKYLITALVERWNSETNTFHLPIGEKMITLQDVGELLGLSIDGEPIILDNRRLRMGTEKCHRMIRKYLGREVDENTFRIGSRMEINISWLKEHFKRLPDKKHDETDEEYERKTQCYIRALILMMLGSLLFHDTNNDSISVAYLPFIKDLSKVRNYNWGSAALEYLIQNLCRACKENARIMDGPVLLLEIWAREKLLKDWHRGGGAQQ